MQELAEQSKELLQQQLQTQLEANQAKRAQVRHEACSCAGSALYCYHLALVHLSGMLGSLALLVLKRQWSRQPSQINDASRTAEIVFVLQSCWQPVSKTACPDA